MGSASSAKKVVCGQGPWDGNRNSGGGTRLQVVRREAMGPSPRIGASKVPVETELSWALSPHPRAAHCILGLWGKRVAGV